MKSHYQTFNRTNVELKYDPILITNDDNFF